MIGEEEYGRELKLLGTKSLQMGSCDPNCILAKICNNHLVALPFVNFVSISSSFLLFGKIGRGNKPL
jgi:hypothetical protein